MPPMYDDFNYNPYGPAPAPYDQGQGAAPPYAAPGYGPPGYAAGAPPYGAPPAGWAPPQAPYGAPGPAYGAPGPAYGAPGPAYGAPPPNYVVGTLKFALSFHFEPIKWIVTQPQSTDAISKTVSSNTIPQFDQPGSSGASAPPSYQGNAMYSESNPGNVFIPQSDVSHAHHSYL